MSKKSKVIVPIITTREGLDASVAEVVELKLALATATAAMEQQIAEVQKQHQNRILALSKQIEVKETSVQLYCERHQAELFPSKKSLDLLLATIGFETTPPRVEKNSSKETWGKIALKLSALDWGTEFVREPDPEVDKQALIAARSHLTKEQLKEAGISIAQDENFFIRPKSEVAEASTKAAA